MEINYSLANDILEDTNNQLKIVSSRTNINETHYKEMYELISKAILKLRIILEKADIINETYCIIEKTIVYLENVKEHELAVICNIGKLSTNE